MINLGENSISRLIRSVSIVNCWRLRRNKTEVFILDSCQVFRRCLSISGIFNQLRNSRVRTDRRDRSWENSSSPQHRDVSRSPGSLGFIYIINRLKPHGCVLKSNLEIPPLYSPTLLPPRGEGRQRLARAITLYYSHARFLPLSDTWENLVEHPPKFQRYLTTMSLSWLFSSDTSFSCILGARN